MKKLLSMTILVLSTGVNGSVAERSTPVIPAKMIPVVRGGSGTSTPVIPAMRGGSGTTIPACMGFYNLPPVAAVSILAPGEIGCYTKILVKYLQDNGYFGNIPQSGWADLSNRIVNASNQDSYNIIRRLGACGVADAFAEYCKNSGEPVKTF